MQFYHGSPNLFEAFHLKNAGNGTGIKFGYGIYLASAQMSAAHYSKHRKAVGEVGHRYLYTVQIPDPTPTNHLKSACPVHEDIIRMVLEKLGVAEVPEKFRNKGKEFRKWIGMVLTGTKKNTFEGEKAAAELLHSIGVLYNIWKPSKYLENYAVFDPATAVIVKIEEIEVDEKKKMITNRQLVYSKQE